MTPFRRHRRSGTIEASLSGFEADLLRSLARQVVELLHDDAAMSATAGPAGPTGEPGRESDPLEALLDFGGPVTEPEDPVLQRLLPAGYSEDPEASAEFRRYTESGLRSSKAAAAAALIAGLEEGGLPELVEVDALVVEVELDEATAMQWARALTDIRLALAVRLGVQEDDGDYWAALPEDDPRGHAHDIYEWTGYLQESLVQAIAD